MWRRGTEVTGCGGGVLKSQDVAEGTEVTGSDGGEGGTEVTGCGGGGTEAAAQTRSKARSVLLSSKY